MIFFQRKLFAIMGISLIALIFFIFLITIPLINKIEESSQEYLANQEILNKLDKREYLSKKLQKSYDETDSDLLIIEKALITKEERVGFIFTLETLAEQTGNIFEIKTASSFTPSKDKEGEPFLALQISIYGNFSNLITFLANLENNPYPPYRLIEIDNLTIRKLGITSLVNLDSSLSEGDLETVLGVKIYIQ